MTIEIEVAVETPAWNAVTDLEPRIQRAIDQAERRAGVDLADGAEISILLCDDPTIRDLNRAWRGIDKATNVLSFPAAAPLPLHEKPLLGDIAVAFETVRREAEEAGKTLPDHLSHLVVHGFLHLVGHDHDDDANAVKMEALETRILAELGIADPYAETEAAEADGS